MEAAGITPVMPPHSLPHIVDALMEMGPVEAAGMDAGPVSWGTIHAWQMQTGSTLLPWQVRLIRRLSLDYLAESRRARDEDCPAPWGAMTQERRQSVDAKLRAAFGGMAKRL